MLNNSAFVCGPATAAAAAGRQPLASFPAYRALASLLQQSKTTDSQGEFILIPHVGLLLSYYISVEILNSILP